MTFAPRQWAICTAKPPTPPAARVHEHRLALMHAGGPQQRLPRGEPRQQGSRPRARSRAARHRRNEGVGTATYSAYVPSPTKCLRQYANTSSPARNRVTAGGVLDRARGVPSGNDREDVRKRRLEAALAKLPVDRIEPCGADADQHEIGPHPRRGQVHLLELVPAAELLDGDRAHVRRLPADPHGKLARGASRDARERRGRRAAHEGPVATRTPLAPASRRWTRRSR